MLSPSLLGSTPFNNRTALVDFAGILDLYHQALCEPISRNFAVAVVKYPLGSGRGENEWLDALTKQHAAEANAMGLAGPPSFSEFDLKDPSEFASFTFLVANYLHPLRRAPGLQ